MDLNTNSSVGPSEHDPPGKDRVRAVALADVGPQAGLSIKPRVDDADRETLVLTHGPADEPPSGVTFVSGLAAAVAAAKEVAGMRPT